MVYDCCMYDRCFRISWMFDILKQHILHEQTTLNVHQNMHKWMDWSPATEETSLTGLEEMEVNLKV